MERNIETMDTIQRQKERDLENKELQPMDAEGRKMAEHKRFTFDVIDVPTDPLR